MSFGLERLWLVALVASAIALGTVPSGAGASIDLSVAIDPTPSAKSAAARAEDDEDEDSFFSNGVKGRSTIATVGPVPRSLANPAVDVVAVCRDVLADNLNYYNYNFIENCRRAVSQGSGRRGAR